MEDLTWPALKKDDGHTITYTNRFMNTIEQIGRYACIILMWLPLLVWKFGFSSVLDMILYLIGNGYAAALN